VLTTPLCRRLGIEAPVLSAGISAGARPELVAAVSNAGGLGVLGLSNAPAGVVLQRANETRALTDRPFGANILLHNESAPATIAACLDAEIPVLVLFWGDAAPFVEQAHDAGAAVLLQVGSVEEAKRAADAGVDAVIAQGTEAGGHVRGRTALSVLVPAVVDAIAPVPVVASGGIADGRGLAAALVLGAQAVSIGTRFVASDEAYVQEEWKRRVVAAGAEDTAYFADLFDHGWEEAPHRVLRNRIVEEWEAAPGVRDEGVIGTFVTSAGETIDMPRYGSFMATPNFEGDLEQAPLWAGQSAELVHDVRPAGEIVAAMVRDAEAALYSVTTYSNDAQQSTPKSRS
jgi:NAD(P)H-dependent flavin oxidoreductase YrpB (nitropropane dioxygenase family)